MNDLQNKIHHATKWSSITEITARLIPPVVNMVLARLLMPEAFGIVATITMVISFAEVFTDAGFQKYLIQHEFRDKEEYDACSTVAFWTNMGISLLLCLAICFFRDGIAKTVGSPALGIPISIASALIVIAAFSGIQMARLKREFDFRSLFFVRIGASFFPLIVTIPLAVLLRNFWALLIGNFASQLFIAIALTLRSSWKPSFFYSFTLLKKMLSFSIWTLLESISIWLTSYIDIFIVGRHLSEHYLGIYKTSMATINSYTAIITGAILPVLFSALSRYQNDEPNFKKTYFSMQRLTALLIFPIGVGTFIFKDAITRILLGSEWMEATEFIGLWGLSGAFVIVFSHLASEVYRSKGKPFISTLSQLAQIALIVTALLIAVRYDFKTICVARTLARVLLPTSLILLRVLFGFGILKTFSNVLPMLISTLAMGGAGYLLQRLNAALWWQIAAILICAALYFTVLLTCFPRTRKEILSSPPLQKLREKLQKPRA